MKGADRDTSGEHVQLGEHVQWEGLNARQEKVSMPRQKEWLRKRGYMKRSYVKCGYVKREAGLDI